MDQSYAPRSPNLAGYAPRSPDLAAYRPTTLVGQDLYAPRSPDLSGLNEQQQHSYPQQLVGPSSFGLDQQLPPQEDQLQKDQIQQQWNQESYQAQPLAYSHSQQPDLYQQQFAFQPQQPVYPQQYQQYPEMPVQTRSRGIRAPGEVGSLNDNNFKVEPEWDPQPAAPTPARRGRKPKSESNNGSSAASTSVMPAMKKMDMGGIEVKTKFPTARIKRIMQADEDVGKVAQVTPVVMAKALELFMIRLISASAGVAKQRGSKRVLSQHMKSAVMQDEQFDNLRDIVGKVPDAPSKSVNVDNSDEEEGAPKKASGRGRKAGAGAGAGRGKKRRDSDDF